MSVKTSRTHQLNIILRQRVLIDDDGRRRLALTTSELCRREPAPESGYSEVMFLYLTHLWRIVEIVIFKYTEGADYIDIALLLSTSIVS